LLVFSKDESERRELCDEFQRNHGAFGDCHVVRIDSRISELFERDQDFLVFLRPDNYIGFISSDVSLTPVAEYFQKQHFS
jgi:hypothetical protein